MALNDALVLVSGPASNPSTTRLLPQLSPASTGTIVATTEVTPGTAASSSSMRSNNWRVRSVVYEFSSGAMPNSTM